MPPLRFDRGARRIALWGLTTISTVALLFSYKTSTSSSTAAETAPTSTTGATATTAAAPSTTSTGARTVTGTAAETRWGPVQVRVTVASGRITAVDVVQQPDGNGHDREINAQAVPTLVDETLQAQSARIDAVSGATYTSEGYVTSLQSALDQAGLA